MKLYEIPLKSKIYGLEPDGDKDGVIIYDHPDGMYSYCYVEGDTSKVCHLGLSMEVRPKGDGYETIPADEIVDRAMQDKPF